MQLFPSRRAVGGVAGGGGGGGSSSSSPPPSSPPHTPLHDRRPGSGVGGGGGGFVYPPTYQSASPTVRRCSLCARLVFASRHRERSPPLPPIRHDEAKTGGGPPGKRRRRRPCVRVSANVFLRARSSRKPPCHRRRRLRYPLDVAPRPQMWRDRDDGLSTLQRSAAAAAAAATAVFLNFSSPAPSKTDRMRLSLSLLASDNTRQFLAYYISLFFSFCLAPENDVSFTPPIGYEYHLFVPNPHAGVGFLNPLDVAFFLHTYIRTRICVY